MAPASLLPFGLRDGTRVGLRPLAYADGARLLEGFDSLSPRSRRYRFLSPLSSLTPAQVRYLTDVNQTDHVAWGAVLLDAPDGTGLGVGRMVRLPEAPGVAEFSLTVVDDAQGAGLGSLLLALLFVLAPPLDIHVLRGYVARDNARMVNWMLRLGAHASGEGSDILLDLPTTPGEWPPEAGHFRDDLNRVRAALRDGKHGSTPPPEAPDQAQ